MIADEEEKVKGGTMKPELEALYEVLCRQEPGLFEPEALHKQLDVLTSAVSLERWMLCCSCVRTGRSTPLRWGLRLLSDC